MKFKTKKTMGKMLLIGLCAALLAGCSDSKNSDASDKSVGESGEKTFKIGISQIIDHKALNDAREGFEERLKELGLEADIDFESADGDVPTSQLIAEKYVSDKVDLIYAIATPAAQTAQNATKSNKIPVIFSAVTDPFKAGLVGENIEDNNVTGVTDEATTANILELLNIVKDLTGDKNSIGVIYNTAEANAVSQVEKLQELTKDLGMQVVAVPISNLTEIDQALEIVNNKAGALYLINDNMVASAVEMIASKAKDKGLITVSTDSSHVEGGAMFSIGLSYKQLGRQAAEAAKQILIDGVSPEDIPVAGSQKLFRFINKGAAEALGVNAEQLITDDTTIIE